MNKTIIVDNITKTFTLSKKQQKIERTDIKKKIAVNGLSFSANKGEIYGLLGPNGAGKTTTLRCISTLIKPDSGDIFINGFSVMNEEEKVRSSIGFLTSELKLEDFFSPNYLYDYFAKLHGIDEEVANERKQLMFKKLGIDKFSEVKVGELSTGMKQKASLAISIVHDPEIIIFDEPTNGLDVLTAKVVTDFLEELRDLGKTIVVSTHIFSVVEKITWFNDFYDLYIHRYSYAEYGY
jgi:sodium transport system ATP-binding protein